MKISDSDKIIDQFNYRGFSFSVYKSDIDSCYYTIMMGKPVKICDADKSYLLHMRDLVDDSLGMIHAWHDSDSKLVEFPNGDSFDLKLVCKGRIIKVYLINTDRIDYDAIIKDAEFSLDSYLKISSKTVKKINNRAV